MSDFDRTNSGALFNNDRKQEAKHPDYTGEINIEGTEYYLSGWKKKSKAGKNYLSLSANPKDKSNGGGGGQSQQGGSSGDDFF